MEESWHQADREPEAQEVGTGPTAVAKTKATTQRVAVRTDQRAPDGRLEVSQSYSDVSGTEASKRTVIQSDRHASTSTQLCLSDPSLRSHTRFIGLQSVLDFRKTE